MSLLVALVAALVLGASTLAQQQPTSELEQFRVVYEWFKLDFTWPDDETKVQAFRAAKFVPENIAISGIKFYRDRLYLTVPRWKEGVPATLVSINATPTNKNASPRLEPFPNWAMNELGNCSALQFVQNVEIDADGKMWVLDTGRVHLMGTIQAKCPPKLVVFDLDRQDNSYRVVTSYTFPDDVVSRNGSYLADIVVDGSYAYISDGGDADPGIIVYNAGASWKVRDNASMVADASVKSFLVNGLAVDIQQNISPLALNVPQQVVYYSPLTSKKLYSIPVSVLKDKQAKSVSSSVKDLGVKIGISSSYVMDDRGVLYFGLLDDNGVAKWDTMTPFAGNQHVIAKDGDRLQWPANFGFDNDGNLWLVSNRLQNFIASRVNTNEPNYRVIQGFTNTKSYLYAKAPEGGAGNMHDAVNQTTEKAKSGGWAAAASFWLVVLAGVTSRAT